MAIRGRPRKYAKTDVRFRITLPQKVLTWLSKGDDHGMLMLSASQRASMIIIHAYNQAHQRK
jgi:hypothetical protein